METENKTVPHAESAEGAEKRHFDLFHGNIIDPVWCVGETGLVVFAVTTGNEIAGNGVRFIAGVYGVLFAFVLLVHLFGKPTHAEMPHWRRRISVCCDLVSIVTLASGGWFWCAGLFLFGLFVPNLDTPPRAPRSLREAKSCSPEGRASHTEKSAP